MTGLEPLAAEIARSLLLDLGKTGAQRAGAKMITAAQGSELEREVASSLTVAIPGAVEVALRKSGRIGPSRDQVEVVASMVAEALSGGTAVGPALLSLDRDALLADSVIVDWTRLVDARLGSLKDDASSSWSELHKLDLTVLSRELVARLVSQLRTRSAKGSLLGLGLHLETAQIERALKIASETLEQKLDKLSVSIPERVAQGRREEDSARLLQTFEKYLIAVSGPESKVKFEIEQVDQTSDLRSLFVDVPIGRRPTEQEWEGNFGQSLGPGPSGRTWRGSSSGRPVQFEPVGVGAAEFFLRFDGDPLRMPWLASSAPPASPQVPMKPLRTLLRGAPGAGKSTITQFVCQIHRARLLAGTFGLAAVPARWEPDQVRWPLRIDIKPLSIWLNGKDPYSIPHADLPFSVTRSVEAFLADHIRRMTRGLEFSVADLYAFLADKHVLLVFDGLDEISESAVSEDVLEHLLTTSASLDQTCASMQVIVTSRPVSPARAPIFRSEGFVDFELLALPLEAAMDYAARWVKAKDLNELDRAQVLNTLSSSLQQDHVKELAHNCMQLAILLAVITANRSALPNGRTPLYAEYVRVFFKREAVKSQLVADHPLTIESIHRRAAWMLQADGERGDLTGASRDWLIEQARELLRDDGKPPELAEQIIRATERNYLLVTRTESAAFDFEVDPLREYFCACHIYETASSKPGADVSSRFDAMIRNPHWFEVTRFFAGMAKSAELAEFAYSLRDLLADTNYAELGHPRVLGFTLLGDRVFRLNTMIGDLTRAFLDDEGIRFGLTDSASRRGMPLSLGSAAWRVVIDVGMERLTARPGWEFAWQVGAAMRWGIDALGSEAAQPLNTWFQAQLMMEGAGDRDARYWLEVGVVTALITSIESDDADRLMARMNDPMDVASMLLWAEQFGVFSGSPERAELAVATVLAGRVFRNGSLHPLGKLADAVTGLWQGYPWWEWASAESGQVDSDQVTAPPKDDVLEIVNSCSDFVDLIHGLRDWTSSAQPWNQMVEDGRARFGDHRMFVVFACIAATMPGLENLQVASDLLDAAQSLCARTAHGWKRRDDPRWWGDQLRGARTQYEQELALVAVMSLASGSVIATLADTIEELRGRIPERWRGAILRMIDNIHCRPAANDPLDRLPELPSPWLSAALAVRATPTQRAQLHRLACRDHSIDDPRVLELCLSECAVMVDETASDAAWIELLEVARRLHAKDAVRLQSLWPSGRLRLLASGLPPASARQVLSQCAEYPVEFVQEADRIIQQDMQSKLEPLTSIAQRDRWFDNVWTSWDKPATNSRPQAT
jgi:hypothetical protein